MLYTYFCQMCLIYHNARAAWDPLLDLERLDAKSLHTNRKAPRILLYMQ